MKIGRFTITSLTESDVSDVSIEAKNPVNADEPNEAVRRPSIKGDLHIPLVIHQRESSVGGVPKKPRIQDTMSSNVLII